MNLKKEKKEEEERQKNELAIQRLFISKTRFN